jgi:hypothetical protein
MYQVYDWLYDLVRIAQLILEIVRIMSRPR